MTTRFRRSDVALEAFRTTADRGKLQPQMDADGRRLEESVSLISVHQRSSAVPNSCSRRWTFAKRAFDIGFSLAVLVVAAPALAVAAIAIRMTSRGAVLYRQERVGRDGRLFTIYKLRTMVEDAESETGPTLACPGDPRITRLGRFLRATKLDEAPQFYNVLRGEMSVIGPRPERPCFVEEFARQVPEYPRRHAVRPGITGLAQVHGGYRTPFHEKLRHDLDYIAGWTPWLDALVLIRTIRAVLQNLHGEF
jgi:exopolysaccharide biosynthesis polyprenyl glycosylphosphotransferase